MSEKTPIDWKLLIGWLLIVGLGLAILISQTDRLSGRRSAPRRNLPGAWGRKTLTMAKKIAIFKGQKNDELKRGAFEMKIKTADPEKAFQPVELTITFESEDELLSWWHTFNMPAQEAIDFAKNGLYKVRCPDPAAFTPSYGLWCPIDKILKDRGLI